MGNHRRHGRWRKLRGSSLVSGPRRCTRVGRSYQLDCVCPDRGPLPFARAVGVKMRARCVRAVGGDGRIMHHCHVPSGGSVLLTGKPGKVFSSAPLDPVPGVLKRCHESDFALYFRTVHAGRGCAEMLQTAAPIPCETGPTTVPDVRHRAHNCERLTLIFNCRRPPPTHTGIVI